MQSLQPLAACSCPTTHHTSLIPLQAGRMNTLLEEMRRSMEELQLGLDGALNMSDKMEALARGIATNKVRAWG